MSITSAVFEIFQQRKFRDFALNFLPLNVATVKDFRQFARSFKGFGFKKLDHVPRNIHSARRVNARRDAEKGLQRHLEQASLPEQCPFEPAQILDPDWFPEQTTTR